MKLYKTTRGILSQSDADQTFHHVQSSDWDDLLTSSNLYETVRKSLTTSTVEAPQPQEVLAPIGSQEVWAAGVTYYRSRTARIEESKDAGGGTFYDRVY